jgi:predicted nucleotidyltransferase
MKVSKKEIAKFQKKEQAQIAGREVNRVQDRKTGEWYNPQERFDTIMNKPEILAMLKRLAVR